MPNFPSTSHTSLSTKQISSAFIICVCRSWGPSFQFEIRQLNVNNKVCRAGIECRKMYSVYFPIRVGLLLRSLLFYSLLVFFYQFTSNRNTKKFYVTCYVRCYNISCAIKSVLCGNAFLIFQNASSKSRLLLGYARV